VLNALVGIAVGQNKLAVNAPAPLHAWAAADDPRRRITVGDLLHMTSGLHFDEAPGSPSSELLKMLFDEPRQDAVRERLAPRSFSAAILAALE
jgi:CubicO group peptidase (beta-lactamase class C family)